MGVDVIVTVVAMAVALWAVAIMAVAVDIAAIVSKGWYYHCTYGTIHTMTMTMTTTPPQEQKHHHHHHNNNNTRRPPTSGVPTIDDAVVTAGCVAIGGHVGLEGWMDSLERSLEHSFK